MEDKTKIPLTAPEMGGLWSQYMSDTLAVCVMRYFLEKVKDEEVRPIIEWTLDRKIPKKEKSKAWKSYMINFRIFMRNTLKCG